MTNMTRTIRRTFIKTSAMAAAGIGLSPRSWAQVRGANDDVRFGVVGFRGRGRSHITDILAVKGARIVALCDVDQTVLDAEAQKLKDLGHTIRTYSDVRQMLESTEIDAISTATPNHWHAPITIWACQAGKDVYVEKPVSHNIWEGQQMIETARKHRRIVQSGTQSRSHSGIQEAVAWVHAGNLGKITLARGLCYKRRPSIGKVTGPQAVPAHINYELWTGPAPMQPLMRKELHYDWHWVWETGNGDLGNQGIHHMDIARWFLGEKDLAPHVFSIGGRVGYLDDGATPNTQLIHHAYAAAPLIFEVRGLPAKAGREPMDSLLGVSVGNVIHCEHGFLLLSIDGSIAAYDQSGRILRTFTGIYQNHHANFVKAIRSRQASDLTADISEGHISSSLCHVANISHRLGQQAAQAEIRERIKGNQDTTDAYERMLAHLDANGVDTRKDKLILGVALSLDQKTQRFVGNDRANALQTRTYRAPFDL
jgi:predicted dehydrogenase